MPVPESDLPVVLPSLNERCVRGKENSAHELDISTPRSPLAEFETWLNCHCPQCGAKAKRETDTLDTFFDSSFYFLRYPDANNPNSLCQTDLAQRWMPVDVYVGGKEHGECGLCLNSNLPGLYPILLQLRCISTLLDSCATF